MFINDHFHKDNSWHGIINTKQLIRKQQMAYPPDFGIYRLDG